MARSKQSIADAVVTTCRHPDTSLEVWLVNVGKMRVFWGYSKDGAREYRKELSRSLARALVEDAACEKPAAKRRKAAKKNGK